MLQSKLFYKTTKDSNKTEDSCGTRLLLQGDYIERLASGIYSFLPLGWRVVKKIADIIRKEMETIEAQEVLLPTLQPKSIWEESGRWSTMEPPLFKIKDQHDKEFALGPTHEEVITGLAKGRIHSYRDLPVALFQIQTKFRNEVRSTGGLLRTREFSMKDLYSFHSEEKDLKAYYEKVANAYKNIFKILELDVLMIDAMSGSIGGETSHEFMVPSTQGEDKVYYCKKCEIGFSEEYLKTKKQTNDFSKCEKCQSILEIKSCIECGHIFNLGNKYSTSMGLEFLNNLGKKNFVLMGCYGIGIGRLLSTVAEVCSNERGIIWPKSIAPFKIHIINLNLKDEESKNEITHFYQKIKKIEKETLYDERQEISAGEKLIEADLIGSPIKIICSEKTIKEGKVEIRTKNDKVEIVDIEKAEDYIKNIL
jgi:prolyl-tRNA synthetase